MKLKKLITILLACMLSIALFGCNNEDSSEDKVMLVSLNPQVEFILDENDKVLSVNALNEEGNVIISASAFTNVEGKTYEEAVKLFIDVSKETGYLINGSINAGENEVSISISGDASHAQKLYDELSKNIGTYFNEIDIDAKLQKGAELTEEKLRELYKECAPYIESAKIKAMTYDELLDELVASREETKEYYSQELKTAYYEMKAYALEQAKFEVLKSKLSILEKGIFEGLNSAYLTAIESLENVRKTNLLDNTSIYQTALSDVRAKKVEYLNFKNEVSKMEATEITESVTQQLSVLLTALETAETTLLTAGETANALIDSAKTTLNTAYNALIETLNDVNESQYVNEILQKQEEKLAGFYTEFETSYGSVKLQMQQNLQGMRDQLNK